VLKINEKPTTAADTMKLLIKKGPFYRDKGVPAKGIKIGKDLCFISHASQKHPGKRGDEDQDKKRIKKVFPHPAHSFDDRTRNDSLLLGLLSL
jgi:hypothetical protein